MSEPNREPIMPFSRETIGVVRRASARSAALVYEEMKEGLGTLATIASIAPWLGLLGTIEGIVNSFVGVDGEKSTIMAATFDGLSQSMWFTAIGLLVGLISLWCYRYLTDRLDTFDLEMEGASLDLVNQLGRFTGCWKLAPATEPASVPSMFGEQSLAELRQDEKFWNRSMVLTGAALFLAWCVQTVRYFEFDAVPLASALWPALKSVLLVFCVSCLPARLIWTRVLHRRRGGLIALASAFCLCWCLAELVWSL